MQHDCRNKKPDPFKPCCLLNIGFGSGAALKTFNKMFMGHNPLNHQQTQSAQYDATTNNTPGQPRTCALISGSIQCRYNQ